MNMIRNGAKRPWDGTHVGDEGAGPAGGTS